ncbi:hypothetical protein E1301_Tti010138 [Triplophysa tibetana]|uniref:Uncharacterized protein n=1 Tax=Triplophysa tibetana TaxID=1572043 RepID=A0A5A9NZ45_9TELE|nr:hypothetical protein E1301_Tti010138 [Triplophysa tibetana]
MATVSQISNLNVSHIDTRLMNAKGSRSEPRHEEASERRPSKCGVQLQNYKSPMQIVRVSQLFQRRLRLSGSWWSRYFLDSCHVTSTCSVAPAPSESPQHQSLSSGRTAGKMESVLCMLVNPLRKWRKDETDNGYKNNNKKDAAVMRPTAKISHVGYLVALENRVQHPRRRHIRRPSRDAFYGCTLGVIEISSDRFSSCVQSKHIVLPAGGEAINETDGESRVRSEALKRLRAKRVAMEVQRTFYNGGSSSIGSSSVLLGDTEKGLK